ncbi:ABC transporter permease [Schumannella soli]|uniref:ABC transporter permease n=1 Tax=Schumannella soli TaxID=2590779 RepID=A0A506XZR8_9MICO|nr:ABC transporter permease [Schumannella soli]TPW75716.1 ABC transporter permease [Schumannella soli]
MSAPTLDPSARAAAPGDTFATTAADRFADAEASRRGSIGPVGRVRRLLRALPLDAILAAVWLLLVLVAAVLPQVIAAGDRLAGIPREKLQGPSAAHLFGTDQLGRDLFTRVVHGTRLTLRSAVLAIGIGLASGAVLGVLAGYVGRWVDDVVMRVTDVLLAIPSLLLSLALITALGFGTTNVAIAVGLASAAGIARVLRAEVVKVRTSTYVEAAVVAGNHPLRVLLRHVLPNSTGPVIALATLELGTAVLAISSLSFLGYGAVPPTPEWGSLVSTGRDYLQGAWWLTTLPGLVIALTVLAANRLARAVDAEGRRTR